MGYLIAGLGNIGAEYRNTRHNIGFMVLDYLAKEFGTTFISSRYASVAEISIKGRKITLIKPSTYMNLSGKAVSYWLRERKIGREDLLVISDDLALPFGTIRMRKQGSEGGHNGLKSITESLGGNNYARLRVGIGDNFSRGGQIDYVLGTFGEEEKAELQTTAERIRENQPKLSRSLSISRRSRFVGRPLPLSRLRNTVSFGAASLSSSY